MQSPSPANHLAFSPNRMKILRLGLLVGACGWIISYFFTFVPWDMARDQLYEMGSRPIRYDPMLDYWMRMASGTFGCIGILLAVVCVSPSRFVPLIKLLGPFHLVMGTILLVSALNNHLAPPRHTSFIADITFCFITGVLIQLPLWFGTRPETQGQSSGKEAAVSSA